MRPVGTAAHGVRAEARGCQRNYAYGVKINLSLVGIRDQEHRGSGYALRPYIEGGTSKGPPPQRP